MSLIMLEQVWKSFGGPDILQWVGFTVGPGERVALLGRNGCGKSTILRIIAGSILPDRGKVQLAKKAVVGYLSQDLSELGIQDAVTEAAKGLGDLLRLEAELARLAESLAASAADQRLLQRYGDAAHEFERLGGYTWQERVRAVLMGLGLRADALHLSTSILSGGERMRVALARLLLMEPDILLLDEPTNHLDLPATQWLESFLHEYAGACLFVSHDRFFIDAVANRCVEVAEGGSTMYHGGYTDYINQKQQADKNAERTAARMGHLVRQEERLVSELKSMGRMRQADSRQKQLDRFRREMPQRANQGRALTISISQPEWVSKTIATVDGAVKKYGSALVLDNVSFTVGGGERIGIIGPNGAGKTTLLRLLTGQEEPTSGTVRLGAWVKWGLLEQEPHFTGENQTVISEVLACFPALDKNAARDLLAKYLFTGETINKPLTALSGGERNRLKLLCLIHAEPHCLILDEPTNHLDITGRECLEEALLTFRGTLLVVSHDRFFLNRVATRILELRDGRLRSFPGNYQSYQKALAANNQILAKSRVPGAVVLTGKQAAKKGGAQAAQVRQKSRERRLDLDKEIAETQKRISELEDSFQQTGFFRNKAAHRALLEHQRLLEHLAVLQAAYRE